jgi:putative endonuclease
VSNLRRVGREGEDRAAAYLESLGYTIVTRRYCTRGGEIDLVALDGEILVFVEVKERRAPGYVPEEGVGERKSARLSSAARKYLSEMGEETREVRFDLIAIDREGLRHHVDAFEMD